jgi:hypothetical protein
MGSLPDKSEPPEHQLILQCAIVAGKIVDRNIAPAKPSFPKTMELYHQMDTIAALTPDSWWEIPDKPPAPGADLNRLVERLLQQFFFFFVKLHLHLPFLVKTAAGSAYTISAIASMDAARHMLSIFLVLHTKVDGFPLFQCKTSDFIGFMAAIILLLGSESTSNLSTLRENHGDKSMIESAWRIFRNEEGESGCKMATQCRKVIGMLADIRDTDDLDHDSFDGLREIPIPYFGTIIRKRIKRPCRLPASGELFNNPSSDHHAPLISDPNFARGDDTWVYEHEFGDMGQSLECPMFLGSDGLDNTNPMLDLFMIDIQQDWGTFPNM